MEKYYSINQNGHSIRCKLYCADPNQISAAVIFGHGFSGDKDNRAAEKLAARIQRRHRQVALVIFDWPCHGEDASAKLSLEGCMAYLADVVGDTKSRFHTDVLYGCATSFGGCLFLHYVNRFGNPFRSIALRCPAIPMYEVLTGTVISQRDLAQLNKGKPVSVGFDRPVKVTREFLAELRENDLLDLDFRPLSEQLVIVQGAADEIIPCAAVQRFAERNEIPYFQIDSADHRFSNPKRMDEAIEIFLATFFEDE